ncbi:hypothetical protein EON65_57645 [archaeon]|nr:MAG: hypothetical protein EON65_57645 [archaeon]
MLFYSKVIVVLATMQWNLIFSLKSMISRSQHVLRLYGNSVFLNKDTFVPDQIMNIPFTGKGCVLLSQPKEYDHWLSKAAILIFEHNEQGSKGLIIDKPSPMTMGSSSPGIGAFESNTLFMGGKSGSDTAVMIHALNLGFKSRPLGYGMYIGGLKAATDMVERFEAHPRDFKFIFNNVEWKAGMLEEDIGKERFDVCCLPPSMLLLQEPKDYGTLWTMARNVLRSEGRLCDMGNG